MPLTRARLVAVLPVLALALAACGGGGDGEGSAAPSAPPAPPAPTGPPREEVVLTAPPGTDLPLAVTLHQTRLGEDGPRGVQLSVRGDQVVASVPPGLRDAAVATLTRQVVLRRVVAAPELEPGTPCPPAPPGTEVTTALCEHLGAVVVGQADLGEPVVEPEPEDDVPDLRVPLSDAGLAAFRAYLREVREGTWALSTGDRTILLVTFDRDAVREVAVDVEGDAGAAELYASEVQQARRLPVLTVVGG